MAKARFNVIVEVDLEDTNPELVKVAGREIIADLSAGTLGHNENVVDIEVLNVEATLELKLDCMPTEEISSLG